MMKNFVQPGRAVTVPAPSTLTAGTGVAIGALFGIASTDADAGDNVTLSVEGVFTLPKEPTTDVFAIGDEVEWDDANGRVIALDSGSRVGVVIASAGATADAVAVRLAG